jgi:putative tryptophan/tyrosine transport system substrate-binding protein
MKKTIIGLALIAMLFAPSVSADAQQPAKVTKIGWLGFVSASSQAPGTEVFRREFFKLGYVEGKNIAFEYRGAEGKPDRLPAVADELVRLKVDVIVTGSTVGALAAKKATTTIPIVFYNVSDPVATGLVDSLARPGGNITGITSITTVLAGKRLELLKETVPKLSRVAMLWNPQNPSNALNWKESQLPARELGLQLHSVEVSSSNRYESAFKEMIEARSSALSVIQDPLTVSNRKIIADLAIKNRLPAIYPREDFVDSGGLMSYGADRSEAFKRVAVFVDKILKGAKPSDLPVEQPTKFELVINLKTAKVLDLTIPPIVLTRATRVIK